MNPSSQSWVLIIALGYPGVIKELFVLYKLLEHFMPFFIVLCLRRETVSQCLGRDFAKGGASHAIASHWHPYGMISITLFRNTSYSANSCHPLTRRPFGIRRIRIRDAIGVFVQILRCYHCSCWVAIMRWLLAKQHYTSLDQAPPPVCFSFQKSLALRFFGTVPRTKSRLLDRQGGVYRVVYLLPSTMI